MLDVREVCGFTDYFVLCNGDSERQLRAIAEEIEEMLSAETTSRCKRQGSTDSGWIILDLGDIVVHIFLPEKREYYSLDEMWSGAATVVKIL